MRIIARTAAIAAAVALCLPDPVPLGGAAVAQTASAAVPIACKPAGPPAVFVRFPTNGTLSVINPNAQILEDQVVTEPMDIGSELPQLLDGTDGGLAGGGCDPAFDAQSSPPTINVPAAPTPPMPNLPPPPSKPPNLPAITFIPPAFCLKHPTDACGRPLDCTLPFCGRDIIFVHGLVFEALKDYAMARQNLASASAQGSLNTWPASPGSFTSNGYFGRQAQQRWEAYILNKLIPRFAAAGMPQGPRFLIVAWPATQRLEFGVHAVLSQIAKSMQTGAGVMTVNLVQPRSIVSANLNQAGFCGRGCVIVSHSAGGPLTVAAMNMAANGPWRPWQTASLRQLPRYIKGHVASHPALSGSEFALQFLAGGCPLATTLTTAFGFAGAGLNGCAAVASLSGSVLYDLAPPVSTALWRPVMSNPGSNPALVVPTLIVASGHPTGGALAAPLHFSRPLLPGFDDGVVSVDNQMGRAWAPPTTPKNLSLGDWAFLGTKYYDWGASTTKATSYFIDQNLELLHRPGGHAAAPNPYLLPDGMRLKNVSLSEVPASSTGLPNSFSFLQSTSGHFFPSHVGTNHGSSQPNDAADSCPAGSYSYRTTGSLFGASDRVNEESRAVFDGSVYTDRGRTIFQTAEASTGTIPLLAPALAGAIEGEVKGRYIRLRLKIGPKVIFNKIFWIWKREYVRMADWRCRDEIDYVLDYAFRR